MGRAIRRFLITQRRWRVGRYVSYVARHATNRDHASEHYYDKIYSEASMYARNVEERLACLVGSRRAEKIMLAEGRRARRPFRIVALLCVAASLRFGFVSFSEVGVLVVAAGCVLLIAGAAVGRLLVDRTIDGFTHRRSESVSSVLGLLTPAGRRSAVRHDRSFPAGVLLETYGETLIARLREKPETVETALLLAEEFDGTVAELLDTARRLD